MTLRSIAIVLYVLPLATLHGSRQAPSTSAGRVAGREADRAAIEKLFEQDIAATVARDPVALSDLWTDDAVRLGQGGVAEVGKHVIRASNDRQTANRAFKVLSYVPETRDLTFLDGGWAVAWRSFTASVESPGAEGKQMRGTVLMVLKKLPDGSWKVFRGMGSVE
jgi:uncharacterized protein (TIGR02246 family)